MATVSVKVVANTQFWVVKRIYVGIECPHVCVLCIDPGPRCHGNFLGPFAGPVRVERMSELTKEAAKSYVYPPPHDFWFGFYPYFRGVG